MSLCHFPPILISRVRPVYVLLIYLAVVFLGAALMAPWLYQFGQRFDHRIAASNLENNHAIRQFIGTVHKTLRQPFHRYVNRSLLLLAVAGLWPFLRSFGIHQWKDLGFAPLKAHWKEVCTGFFLGFCSLAFLAGMALWFGARILDFHQAAATIARDFLAALFIALAVALLEETLFRGALFGTLQRAGSRLWALTLSSAIYALVHFFAKAEPPASVTWLSGFVTLGNMLRGFADLQMLVPGFINLFLAGSILALAFRGTGNLYFSIGLHAGWIFWLQSYRTFTDNVSGVNSAWWGGAKMIDGWLATVVLSLTGGVVFFILKEPDSPSPSATK